MSQAEDFSRSEQYPLIVAEREVMRLWAVFERAVYDKSLSTLGGHWLWGVSTFVFDPYLPFPNVLPVIGGKIWPSDFDGYCDPLTLDHRIRDSWRGQLDCCAAALPVANAERAKAEEASKIIGAGGTRTEEEISDELARRLGTDHAPVARHRRSVGCPAFGRFDDVGFDFLARVMRFLVEGLASESTFALGVAWPKDGNLSVKQIRPEWFRNHIRIDFLHGSLEDATSKDGPPWHMRFSEIEIVGKAALRDRMGQLLRSGRLPRPGRPASSSMSSVGTFVRERLLMRQTNSHDERRPRPVAAAAPSEPNGEGLVRSPKTAADAFRWDIKHLSTADPLYKRIEAGESASILKPWLDAPGRYCSRWSDKAWRDVPYRKLANTWAATTAADANTRAQNRQRRQRK